MSMLERIRPRRPATGAPPPEPDALARRREELAAQVAELQFDLGGLAYEMAIRDHFRLDVLVKRAAELQQADGELGEVDRLLHAGRTAETGTCPACDAPHSRGAVFCWQCGGSLIEPSPGPRA
jgi:hypothetical protein